MFKGLESKIENCKSALKIAGLAGTLFVLGCNGDVKLRFGCLPTLSIGTNFLDPNELGNHSYSRSFGEGDGIVYTCKGGHIDITHLRIAADYTKNIKEKIYDCLVDNKKKLRFKSPVEKSVHKVEFSYPDNWDLLPDPEKKRIAEEFSLKLAPYISFSATIWHEMLTWEGYKCSGFISENASAFSWEDIYSNLLGCILSVEAMKDKRPYDEAMTHLIKVQLDMLGIRSKEFARDASEKMRGNWYNGYVFVEMKKKNFDIGIGDRKVTPCLVPGLSGCENPDPVSYDVPALDFLKDYDISIKYTIKPREFEKDKLLRIVYPDREGKVIEPIKDFPIIIKKLEKEAFEKGCEIR